MRFGTQLGPKNLPNTSSPGVGSLGFAPRSTKFSFLHTSLVTVHLRSTIIQVVAYRAHAAAWYEKIYPTFGCLAGNRARNDRWYISWLMTHLITGRKQPTWIFQGVLNG